MLTFSQLSMQIAGPFVISSRHRRPRYVHAFPQMWRMPGGRLFLSISKERDVHDQERFLLVSDDKGRSFHAGSSLPTAKYPGACANQVVDLGQGRMLNCLGGSFATRRRGSFILPTWESRDGGRSWGAMQASRLTGIPWAAEAVDIYDPPPWWKQTHESEIAHGFVKPAPPRALHPLYRRFSRRRGPGIMSIVQVSGRHLLGLIDCALARGECSSVLAVRSKDGGRSWRFVAVAARYHTRYVDPSVVQPVDGFCEPAMVRLPGGELLAVLRMGSCHPLYAVRSRDNGESWTPPRKLPVRGVRPQLVRMTNGALALLTGRPGVTLNLSVDRGRTWPFRVNLLEYGRARRSTSNTAMTEVEPNRLLCVYDSFRTDRAAKDYWLRDHGHGKVMGCLVEIRYREGVRSWV